MPNITKRFIDSLQGEERDKFYFDSSISGFGVKVTPKGRKSFICQYRIHTSKKRYTIGTYGAPWTVEKAKTEAQRLLGLVADGKDPAQIKKSEKSAPTVSELCDLYLKEGCGTKKASTIATDQGRIERHIKPLLGKKRVKDLGPNDIKRFMDSVAKGKTAKTVKTGSRGLARVTGGKGTATRTVGLLGGILSFAAGEGLIERNPVQGVKRFPDKKNERFLSPEEFKRLGDALQEAQQEGLNHYGVQGIRLLLLTGCRKNEILSLRWNDIDFKAGYLNLPESKTGQKRVPVGGAVLEILYHLPKVDDSDFVFPAQSGDGHYQGLPKVWRKVRDKAGLEDVRLHDLRHSFASVAAASGMGLTLVGKILGHKDVKTTSRYAHIADDPAKTAAERVTDLIYENMEKGQISNKIVNLKMDKR